MQDGDEEFAAFRQRLAGMSDEEYNSPAVQAELRRFRSLQQNTADQLNQSSQSKQPATSASPYLPQPIQLRLADNTSDVLKPRGEQLQSTDNVAGVSMPQAARLRSEENTSAGAMSQTGRFAADKTVAPSLADLPVFAAPDSPQPINSSFATNATKTQPANAFRTAQNRWLFFAALAVVAAGLGAGGYFLLNGQTVPTGNTTSSSHASVPNPAQKLVAPTSKTVVTPSLQEVQAQDPDYSLKPEKVSDLFQGFASWDHDKKIDFVSDIMNVQVLPEDVLALFKREMQSKQNDHLLRNNMANALMAQKKYDYTLEDIFWKMFHDTTESVTWRDYSLQFYAQCAPKSAMPNQIRDNLLSLITPASDHNSATAAVMLAFEANEKSFALPADFNDRLEKCFLTSSDNNLQAAALSIFARLGAKDKLPLLREKAASKDRLIRRVAIAAIGQLGEKSDLDLLKPYSSDPDKLVAMAARSATERLQTKK